MANRTSEAIWQGTLKEGNGVMKLGSGAYEGSYTRASRFEDGPGTNPEELIAAAHAGCYSMFLSALLSNNNFVPTRIHTTALVHMAAGPTITGIDLTCQAEVPGVGAEQFASLAEEAKTKCPVSKALASVEIKLQATLL